MKDLNSPLWVVDFKLKDNRGEINTCVIFKSNGKCSMSIVDREEILNTLTNNFREIIYIQNKCIHGSLPLDNIEDFTVREILSKDF